MIKELQRLISQSKHGAEELTQQAIDQAIEYQAQGGTAYISLDTQGALAAAKAADLIRESGYIASPIAGLTISIKDLYDVQGQVNSSASKVLSRQDSATQDASAVLKLRNAGAVLFGRTNMSEFAFSGLGLNPHYGTPTYADQFTRIAGGSTSGGAVSVALGHSVAALGSDTGGSLRIPAAFCGLVGFKPSSGRISTDGAFPLSFSYDTVGTITHTVEDNIILDEILSEQKFHKTALQPKQLKIAITDDYVLDDAEPEVLQAYHATLKHLENHGIVFEKVNLSELYQIPEINHAGGLTAAEAWYIHRDLLNDPQKYAQYDQRVAQRISRGQHISAADYLLIQKQRQALIDAVSEKLASFDAWIYPTVAITPPLLEPLQNDDDLFFKTNAIVLRNTTVINFIDGCALSLPCHQAGQLPVGLSIAGLHGQDQHILNISCLIETLINTETH
ncbi:amidase [Acinetobacter sp. ANC 4558]|uniref:amidase n=1 Tax=Acinetobacter sp. ANC 4558 TaxID=1977876 RepID=UPI000A35BA59|nr:amidase [Acinetobacter sp. ANC 4558]OTG87411.1 amidase [Acinetobacter sp. ANC 4558]